MAQPRSDVQQSLVLLDTYQRQLEAISQQLNLLQSVLEDAHRAHDAIEGLEKEASRELLVPLGSNTFIYADAKKGDRVLTGIGAGYSMEKTRADAARQVAKRAEEIQKEMQRLTEAAVQMQSEAARLEEELNEVMDQGAPKK